MTYVIWTRRETLRGALGAAGVGAAGACASSIERPDASASARFEHGVASGDPLKTGIVIWTRATPTDPEARSLNIRWALARRPDMTDLIRTGEYKTDALRDFTVKIDVRGLEPGEVYYYQFFAGAASSSIGRTRTLPTGRVDELKIAAASCSNFPFGHFHAYQHMADRGDIDLIIHLGDYIYEYGGEGSWGQREGEALGRAHAPAHEVVTLEDYRARHAQYKTDRGLQSAHGVAPWLCSWDDHEITNNPWMDGAQNHNPENGEGPWADRKANAMRAYFEWMPVRDPKPGAAREALWRSFEFGDLATLVMLETRLTGRTKQLTYDEDLPFVETAFDVSDPSNPRPLRTAAEIERLAPQDVITVPTPFDVTGPRPRPILSWLDIKAIDQDNPPDGVAFIPNTEKFVGELLNDDARMMIGADQERFVGAVAAASVERGATWQVFGNQIIFARQTSPNLIESWSEDERAALVERQQWLAGRIDRTRYELPSNLDAWDGYPVQRDRLSDAFAKSGASVVMLTGDTHTFWANELYDTAGRRYGAEFGTAGISSPGWAGSFAGPKPDFMTLMEQANKEVVWGNGEHTGYVLLTLTREEGRAEFIAIDRLDDPGVYDVAVLKSFRLQPRSAGGELSPLEELS